MKPYEFNGELYNDLDTLAHSYIENYKEAINDIYTNSKKLVKFVKAVKKDKEFVKEIVSIITYSKYKNNALTFIIFNFLDEKKVYINGKEFTFKSFVEALKDFPDKNSILFAFMEDFGISKTFAQLEEGNKILQDSFYIDKYYKDPFTYKYLTTCFDYQIVESLYARMSTIAVNGEECFRRATKVASNEDFQLGIAHKFGFRVAIEMHNEVNPLFYAVKQLKNKNEIDESLLKKLIEDTFYWWILDNLDKYIAIKKEAKDTFVRLADLKKEYQKYQDMILERRITDLSIELIADLSRSIYLNYLNFVTLFRDGKIMVKPRYSEQSYAFDKPYCKTYITADYMKDHIVKLYNPNKDNKELVISINPLTGKEIVNDEEKEKGEIDIDDISEDKPVLIKIDDVNIQNEIAFSKKVLRKNSALATFSIVFALINSIVVIGFMVASMLLKDANIKDIGKISPKKIFTLAASQGVVSIAIAAISLFLVIAVGITLNVLSNNSLKKVQMLEFIENARTKEKISPKQEAKMISLLMHENEYKGELKKKYLVVNVITLFFYVVTFSLLLMIMILAVSTMIPRVKFKGEMSTILIYTFAGSLLGVIPAVIVKKRGPLIALLADAIALIVILIVAVLLGV